MIYISPIARKMKDDELILLREDQKIYLWKKYVWTTLVQYVLPYP